MNMQNKDENKAVSLTTAKINYMDPRVTVAWCKRNEVSDYDIAPHLSATYKTYIGALLDYLFSVSLNKLHLKIHIASDFDHNIYINYCCTCVCLLLSILSFFYICMCNIYIFFFSLHVVQVPIEKIFPATLQNKFNWAMSVPSSYSF